MKTSVDVWLCNLYFNALPLPHYIDGQVEVELQVEPTGVIQTHKQSDGSGLDMHGIKSLSVEEG